MDKYVKDSKSKFDDKVWADARAELMKAIEGK